MHNAPAVSYPVGRSRFQAKLLSAVCLLGMLTCTVWFNQAQTPDWRQWLMLFGTLVTPIATYWQWRQTVTGQLAWEGLNWSWTESEVVVTVQLAKILDVQHAMLLMLRSTHGAQFFWIWVERDASPARWLALRRAVHQHPSADKDPLMDGNPQGKSTV